MRLYTVQLRPGPADRRNGGEEAADPDVVLIKEGFCWPALFMPLLWLLYRGQFWGLLAYLGLVGLFSALTFAVGLDALTALVLSLVLSLFMAAQANDWRRWRLSARGYQLASVVAAGSLRQAETIFFHTRWQGPERPPARRAQAAQPLPASGLTPFATPFDPV
jgi:hypothetical protein